MMTFNVEFHTEHALLHFVKTALADFPRPLPRAPFFPHVGVGAAAVLACHAAIEAIANRLLERDGRLRHYDELRLKSKLDTLAELDGRKLNWGELPWQEITRLIRLRNWLAHNKEIQVGLVAEGGERVGKPPRIDPESEFDEGSVRSFYNAVRNAGLQLSRDTPWDEEFKYLQREQYEPLLFG